ncbi:MAG TPA: Sbal_3080 family lipoprotein [Usitatibacter sp.]|nr:Sbal_3080 family lipoprotein [Usitatibacter sp.]
MRATYKLALLGASAVFAAGCAITQKVQPVTVADITQLCVKRNPAVMMDGFIGELESQLRAKGMQVRVFDGARPSECRHHLEYTANWRWDLAMYLVYAELRVYESDLLVGQANYDARGGGGRMDKFGATAEKLRPLIDQLFPRRA